LRMLLCEASCALSGVGKDFRICRRGITKFNPMAEKPEAANRREAPCK
jgi:hypothetical protein